MENSKYLEKDINNMKCWAFRIAEKKWGINHIKLAKLFHDQKLYEVIDNGYDYLHLMSYNSVVDELKIILQARGIKV